MPPKKDNKKQAQAKPDNSGIPKQDIEFRFTLNFKSDASQLPAYVIMFEWFGAISDKLERFDTGLLQTWKKDQNSYTFEKQCEIIRVDDDFCKTLSTKRFYLYFVNAQDNKVEDIIYFDYSSLLLSKSESKPEFYFESNTIKILNLDFFSLKLTADKQILGQVYKHYLNPFQIEVIGAKDVPVQKSSKYQPTYVKYTFFDGTVAQTHPIVGNDKLLWSHKHVFLAGLLNPVELIEKMRSKYLKFQLHDRDQVNNKKIKNDVEIFDITRAIEEEMQKEKPVEDDKKKGAKKQEKKQVKKEAKKDTKKKDVKIGEPILPAKNELLKNNYGVSAFYLVQFLKNAMKTARYKAPVVPKNTFEDFESTNIDLNTTARNQMQKVISSNNYFDCDTVLVVSFTLSYPIGTFVKPEIKEEVVEDPKKKKESKQPAVIQKKSEPDKEIKKDVFERLVYVIPYRDKQSIKKIEEIFYNINMKAFNLKNKRQITTHLLKKQQKQDIKLNYLTGIQIIDPEGRIYILEGLRNGGIEEFHKVIKKNGPNSKDFKIFKNSSISFSHRLFADYNIQLKRIRLRPSLSQVLLDPSIYIKSKVPQQICQNLNKLSDIRKVCDDLQAVDAMNLWPNSQWLIQIERKFSQSLSFQDLTGEQQQKTKNSKNKDTAEPIKTIRFMENTQLKYVTTDDFFLPKIPQAEATNQVFANTANQSKKKVIMTKTFTKDNGKMSESYQMRGKNAQIGPNEAVYVYGGQTNNFYEKQLREWRQKMHNNPNIIYTYSKDHFNLALEPYNLEDVAKKEKQLNLTKMYSKDKFSSLLVKTKDQRMKLPKKPNDEDIHDLIAYPYHEQKQREKQLKKNVRDLPLNNGKDDFKKYLKQKDIFMEYPVMEGQKVSMAEKQKQEREQKKRLEEEQKKKLLGDHVIKIKKGYCSDKVTGVDRFKDIREGSPNKLGITDIHKRTKSKREIEEYEVSLFLKEDKIDPSFNPLIRKDNSSLNIQKDEFNFYQRPQILTKTHIFKPLKDVI